MRCPVPDLLILDEVDSTNTYAREHFDGLPDGTLVVARRQTAGRGRRGRAWLSPPGVNFTGSILFKQLEDGFHAGCLLGVAALALLRELTPGMPAYLKWPNDIYVEDRKLAGILSESARIEQGRITAVVSGIGINVNLPPETIAAIDQPATSLLAETGQKFNLDFFSKKLAEQLIRYYIIYLKSAGAVLREWNEANLLVGETLTVVDPRGGKHVGIFREILEDGSMSFEENGAATIFRCGDVKISRESIDWRNVNQKCLEFSSNFKQPKE
ncbi:MAG: biotin--[acetyl-CoA-carboxylase] ligase [Lentisphaeria bacterium]|nr:biotin--[acetyl-CoA-carboxylase] ligase [Lentisphaeria bacterium]